MSGTLFRDRAEAGRLLGGRLVHLALSRPVVLGLPRGGIPVAAEVAKRLGAPLDVIVVRKIGAPHQRELAIGAIGEGGVRVVNEGVVSMLGLTSADVRSAERQARRELDARTQWIRERHERIPLVGRTVVVVDDGVATGSTARAACRVARAQGAAQVVLAVPIAPAGWTERLGSAADDYVSLHTPAGFQSVGQWYENFGQTTEEEVMAHLDASEQRAARSPDVHTGAMREVIIPVGGDHPAHLEGHLSVPPDAWGVVLFAHGSGSSRLSPRNQYVAQALNEAGIATLLFDLLTNDEAGDRHMVFDIDLLSARLVLATRWLDSLGDVKELPVGYFGASTGAAAAILASTDESVHVAAVVSRGGRPDLARDALAKLTSPTLLIVGGDDGEVLSLNEAARTRMTCRSDLVVIPGATHLFEEPGTLEQAANAARDWFASCFGGQRPHSWRDPSPERFDALLARAREEAEGVDVFGDPDGSALVFAQREEAEGIELFEDAASAVSGTSAATGDDESPVDRSEVPWPIDDDAREEDRRG